MVGTVLMYISPKAKTLRKNPLWGAMDHGWLSMQAKRNLN
jgi:hypothetical protein